MVAPKDVATGLTQERLVHLFHYDPETGAFTRLVRMGQRGLIGSRADFPSKGTGYRVVKIEGHPFYAHRLAWLYMTGAWPTEWIDHDNLDRGDTRWGNLRPATRGQNNSNRGAVKTSRSGVKGAYPMPSGRFTAAIRHAGKIHHLGCFDTAEEANTAYAEAALSTFGPYARSA
jgi:hypothetical protein